MLEIMLSSISLKLQLLLFLHGVELILQMDIRKQVNMKIYWMLLNGEQII